MSGIFKEYDLLEFYFKWLFGFPRDYATISIPASMRDIVEFLELLARWRGWIVTKKDIIKFNVFGTLFPDIAEILVVTIMMKEKVDFKFEQYFFVEKYIYYVFLRINWYLIRYLFIEYCDLIDFEIYKKDAPIYIFFKIIILWLKMIICSIFTIWSRGVGPRFRTDQMSDISWKEVLVLLIGLLFLSIFFIILG